MVNAGTLRDQVAEGSQAEKIISQIELVSKRAATLTSRLLTFSRRDILKPQVLDPVSIAKESKGFLKPLLDDNVNLDVSIDGKPPPVKCDAAQLLQVIMNVVINAGEALRGQGGKIALKVAPQRKAGCITGTRISVTDNGPGIDDAIRAHMFQPFVTTKAHGTGLGLATVRDIVTGAGGSIDVTSGPGQGTTFTFVLPAHSGGVRADQESPAVVDLPVNGCVVIVDDEPLVREASARALEQAGIEVRVADGAESALAIIEELGNRAALLLTDVVMPHMGGRELAARAAEILPNLPVLYMTGYTDDTILLHGVEAHSVELLRKPFSPQILVHTVKLTLARAAGR
jgi:CheY-like chemotaxis protein